MYNQTQLNEIVNKLNKRPRRTVGSKTPAEVSNDVLRCTLKCVPVKNGTISVGNANLEKIS